MTASFDPLKLENQLCFPLYVAAKEVVGRYKPFLAEMSLTYTQYIAMLVLWERQAISVKELGERLYLDSGTLTPLLKRLESKGFISRERSKDDERVVNVTITGTGQALRAQAKEIPARIAGCMPLSPDDARTLYGLLYQLLK